MNFCLENIHLADMHGEMKGNLSIIDGKISYLENKNSFSFPLHFNYYAYPAFINAHDHLLGSYYPRVGKGHYNNWLSWDKDLKTSKIYEERSLFSPEEIYLLGSLKNLISGAVFVQDHIPHHINKKIIPFCPIHIIKDYTLSHAVSSYDLHWGDPQTEHALAVKNHIPFITHIAEGYDEESRKGVFYLKQFNALDENTVLVHGLQLSSTDIQDIKKAKAHCVWCPVSNYFMYNDLAPIEELLKNDINVSLGTDSLASGGFNILDEIQKGLFLYEKFYQKSLDPKILFRMITSNPAKAFQLKNAGSLQKEIIANIVITKKVSQNIYSNIAHLKLADIALVIKDGLPIYGDETFKDLFSTLKIKATPLLVEGEKKLLAHPPSIKLLKKLTTIIKYDKYLPFLPIML